MTTLPLSKWMCWKIFWKLYWKEVVDMWLWCVIMWIFIMYFLPEDSGGVVVAIKRGLIGGSMLSVFGSCLSTIDHMTRIQKLTSHPEEILTPYYTCELKIPYPYDEVFNFCINAVHSIGKYKIVSADLDQGKIIAKTRRLLKRNVILFNLQKANNVTIVYVITKSVSIFGYLRPLDYGHSLKCMLRLQQILSPYSGIKSNNKSAL